MERVWMQDYRPGSVLFLKGSGILSDAISTMEGLQERSDFGKLIGEDGAEPSHVALVISETMGIEASVNGVQPFFLSKYLDDPSEKWIFKTPAELDEVTYLEGVNYAMKIVGTPYDFPGLLLGFPVVIMSHLENIFPFLKRWPLPFHLPGSHVCDTFVADVWSRTKKYQNEKIFKEWNIERISPAVFLNEFPWDEGGSK